MESDEKKALLLIYSSSPRDPKRSTNNRSKIKTTAATTDKAPTLHTKSIRVVFGGQ